MYRIVGRGKKGGVEDGILIVSLTLCIIIVGPWDQFEVSWETARTDTYKCGFSRYHIPSIPFIDLHHQFNFILVDLFTFTLGTMGGKVPRFGRRQKWLRDMSFVVLDGCWVLNWARRVRGLATGMKMRGIKR